AAAAGAAGGWGGAVPLGGGDGKIRTLPIGLAGNLIERQLAHNVDANAKPISEHQLVSGTTLTIGRAADCQIRLAGLQISDRHARITNTKQSQVFIEDTNS